MQVVVDLELVKLKELTLPLVILYSVLRQEYNEIGEGYAPRNSFLGDCINQREDAVRTQLNKLEELGLIQRKLRTGKTSVIKVIPIEDLNINSKGKIVRDKFYPLTFELAFALMGKGFTIYRQSGNSNEVGVFIPKDVDGDKLLLSDLVCMPSLKKDRRNVAQGLSEEELNYYSRKIQAKRRVQTPINCRGVSVVDDLAGNTIICGASVKEVVDHAKTLELSEVNWEAVESDMTRMGTTALPKPENPTFFFVLENSAHVTTKDDAPW